MRRYLKNLLTISVQDSPDDGLHSEGPGRHPGAAALRRRPHAEEQGRMELLSRCVQGGRPSGRATPARRYA